VFGACHVSWHPAGEPMGIGNRIVPLGTPVVKGGRLGGQIPQTDEDLPAAPLGWKPACPGQTAQRVLVVTASVSGVSKGHEAIGFGAQCSVKFSRAHVESVSHNVGAVPPPV
jgi:hypothetical protein